MYPLCIYILRMHIYIFLKTVTCPTTIIRARLLSLSAVRAYFTGCKRNNCNPPPFPRVFCSPPSCCFFFLREPFFRLFALLLPRIFGCSDARDHTVQVPSPSPIDLPPSALPLSFSPPFFLCFFLRHGRNGGGGLVPSSPLSPCPCPPQKIKLRNVAAGIEWTRVHTPPHIICMYVYIYKGISGCVKRCDQGTL